MAHFGDGGVAEAASAALARPAERSLAPTLHVGEELLRANLYGICELVAARAASPSTRRQYAAIYRRFSDALRAELGCPPEVGDLTADAVAAYARALERDGGRAGRPMALATRRVHLTMLRALAAQLGLEAVAGEVRPPSHRVGPPETLTHVEYANLLRVPDRRARAGKRDHALLRVLGDCRLRNEELRGLPARALRRPRAKPGRRAPRAPGPSTRPARLYATTLAAEGVPVHVIAARLGHAEIQTTSRYLPSSPTTAPRWATCSTATITRCAAGGSPPSPRTCWLAKHADDRGRRSRGHSPAVAGVHSRRAGNRARSAVLPQRPRAHPPGALLRAHRPPRLARLLSAKEPASRAASEHVPEEVRDVVPDGGTTRAHRDHEDDR